MIRIGIGWIYFNFLYEADTYQKEQKITKFESTWQYACFLVIEFGIEKKKCLNFSHHRCAKRVLCATKSALGDENKKPCFTGRLTSQGGSVGLSKTFGLC